MGRHRYRAHAARACVAASRDVLPKGLVALPPPTAKCEGCAHRARVAQKGTQMLLGDSVIFAECAHRHT